MNDFAGTALPDVRGGSKAVFSVRLLNVSFHQQRTLISRTRSPSRSTRRR